MWWSLICPIASQFLYFPSVLTQAYKFLPGFSAEKPKLTFLYHAVCYLAKPEAFLLTSRLHLGCTCSVIIYVQSTQTCTLNAEIHSIFAIFSQHVQKKMFMMQEFAVPLKICSRKNDLLAEFKRKSKAQMGDALSKFVIFQLGED